MKNLIEFLVPEFSHRDERGGLTQLVSSGWSQINVLISKAGAKRGGHYHKERIEAFYIASGSCDLILDSIVDNTKQEFDLEQGSFFIIKSYIRHTFYFKEDTVMIAMYDKPVIINDKIDIYE